MIKEYYDQILAGNDVRANLIALRAELKEEKNKRAFAYLLGGDFTALCGLLKDTDPKVRRNAARILGLLESEDVLPILLGAYEKEETLFVRADYLKAMEMMDCSTYTGYFETQLAKMRAVEYRPEEQKHASEEIRQLQSLILKNGKIRQHRFAGEQAEADVILVTNRCQREVTARQITTGKRSLLAGGVRVRGANLGEILKIRTYSELLFPLETRTLQQDAPEQIGALVYAAVLGLAESLYEGDDPYRFRIELKSRIAPEKKGNYIRKISDGLEKASEGRLINSVTDYELELRLLEKKDGTFVPMLKCCTIPDRRFTYRKQVVASSIAPVNAALTAELARPWLKEGAQILDPFCGVGTMLVERNWAVPAGAMYGIDIFGEAIEKARTNTAHCNRNLYYINKDFFEFEHEYLFDEVITDMPQVTAAKPKAEIRALYLDFFRKIPEFLKEEAVLVLYATEPQFAQAAMDLTTGFCLEKKFMINEKNNTSVLVIRWRK